MAKEQYWLEYCKSCKRKHRFMLKPCPTCNVYDTPQPVSGKVYDKCWANYEYDGCWAYKDHTNLY